MLEGLIDRLKNMDFDIDKNLLVIGGRLGMIDEPEGLSIDEKRVPTWGVPCQFIRSGKLHRGLKKEVSFRQFKTTVRLLFGFFGGFIDAFRLIHKFKPDVIFSSGGYVSLPVVIAGKILRKKTIIHEQTLGAGLANRIASKFADKVLVTFSESAKFFPPKKVRHTGNIIRKTVKEINYENIPPKLKEMVEASKVQSKPLIYITGGGLGSHKVNVFVGENIKKFQEKYLIIWQTGDNRLYCDYEKYKSLTNPNSVYITKFVGKEIGYVMKNSDFVISRPGANTLYELAYFQKRAIFIPLWVTSDSDQLQNARWYCDNYNAKILFEHELSFQEFVETLELLSTCDRISLSSVSADSDIKIIDEILK